MPRLVPATLLLVAGSLLLSGAGCGTDRTASGRTGAQSAPQDPVCDLEGAWEPVSLTLTAPDGTVDEVEIGDPPGLKILSDRNWVFVEEGSGDQGSTSGGGGTYRVEGTTYTEVVQYHDASSYVGEEISFDCRTEDGRWYQSGELPDGTYLEEVYRRLE